MMKVIAQRSWRRIGLFIALPVLALVLMLAFAPQVDAESPEASSGFNYTVQWGDSLSAIAVRYGTTVYAISQANGIVNPNLIYAGQVLWIPTAYYPPTPSQPIAQHCRAYHTVTWGDTLNKLGVYYGVSPWAIAQANNIYNLNLIYRGQTLCIP
jgi:LysM repeat protein